jgi:2-oxoglutarate ferredoxin oxidoreductase subunit gamma
MELKLSGFGGQGIIRMGLILGKAASIHDTKNATLTQSFGPEARGGACSAQVIVSEERILYPYLTAPDVLVAMSQEAYDKFEPELKPEGILLIEEDLVRSHPPREHIRQYAVPATRIAEKLGNRMFANLVMLGFLGAITGIVSRKALLDALPGMVPDRLLQKNLDALNQGYEAGQACVA